VGSRLAFVDRGTGESLILVPGVQGRWEWMRPTVDALARRFRVITCSLPGEPGGGRGAGGFEACLAQIDEALAFGRCDRAILCGVSYGGLVAVSYASARPAGVSRLVLVSAPAPAWTPDARVQRYAKAPATSALAFVAGAPARLGREITAAIPDRRGRLAATAGYLFSIVRYSPSPRRMAARVRQLAGRDFGADARRVQVPTLVITGEPSLDRVVPVEGTREYLALIPGSVGATLERTGHIGPITRPDAFAEIVWRWRQGAAGSGSRTP
jgi:3-oxoadipate enol-lactonase